MQRQCPAALEQMVRSFNLLPHGHSVPDVYVVSSPVFKLTFNLSYAARSRCSATLNLLKTWRNTSAVNRRAGHSRVCPSRSGTGRIGLFIPNYSQPSASNCCRVLTFLSGRGFMAQQDDTESWLVHIAREDSRQNRPKIADSNRIILCTMRHPGSVPCPHFIPSRETR